MHLNEDWLAYEKKLGFRPKINGTWQEIRAAYNGLCDTIAAQYPPADPSLLVQDIKISESLAVRVYTPRDAPASTDNGRGLPLGVYAHGGGFVAGSVRAAFEDYNCRYIALNTPCVLVSVDFRLAPEFPVPAQCHDVLRGFEWAYDNCEGLGGDKAKCFLIGASVGGGLALGAALRLLDNHDGSSDSEKKVAGVVALAPITLHPEHVPPHLAEHFTSYDENAEGPLIDRDAMYNFNAINGCDEMKDDPYVFPALHPRLSELPPLYISTCGADPLRDDGTVIAVTAKQHGIPCATKNYEGLPHFFWIFPEIQTGDTFRSDTVEGVRSVLGMKA